MSDLAVFVTGHQFYCSAEREGLIEDRFNSEEAPTLEALVAGDMASSGCNPKNEDEIKQYWDNLLQPKQSWLRYSEFRMGLHGELLPDESGQPPVDTAIALSGLEGALVSLLAALFQR